MWIFNSDDKQTLEQFTYAAINSLLINQVCWVLSSTGGHSYIFDVTMNLHWSVIPHYIQTHYHMFCVFLFLCLPQKQLYSLAFLWWPWVTGELITLGSSASFYACTLKNYAVISCLGAAFLKGLQIALSVQNCFFLLMYVRSKDIYSSEHYSIQFSKAKQNLNMLIVTWSLNNIC